MLPFLSVWRSRICRTCRALNSPTCSPVSSKASRGAVQHSCHRASTRIVRHFGVIAVEDLRIRNMTAVARGTLEEPGGKVRAKAGLNRSVLTQTWANVRNQLRHNAEWAGRECVAVIPACSWQDCHRCGQRRNPGRNRVPRCRANGLSVDRDLNAAIVIRRAGSLALASRTCRGGESAGAERYASVHRHCGMWLTRS